MFLRTKNSLKITKIIMNLFFLLFFTLTITNTNAATSSDANATQVVSEVLEKIKKDFQQEIAGEERLNLEKIKAFKKTLTKDERGALKRKFKNYALLVKELLSPRINSIKLEKYFDALMSDNELMDLLGKKELEKKLEAKDVKLEDVDKMWKLNLSLLKLIPRKATVRQLALLQVRHYSQMAEKLDNKELKKYLDDVQQKIRMAKSKKLIIRELNVLGDDFARKYLMRLSDLSLKSMSKHRTIIGATIGIISIFIIFIPIAIVAGAVCVLGAIIFQASGALLLVGFLIGLPILTTIVVVLVVGLPLLFAFI